MVNITICVCIEYCKTKTEVNSSGIAIKQVDLLAFHLLLIRRGRQAARLTVDRAPQARYLPCACRRVCGSGSELSRRPPPSCPSVRSRGCARPCPPRPTPRPFPGPAFAGRPCPLRPGTALFTAFSTELGFTALILHRAAATPALPLLLSWRWRWRWRAAI
jgi:hypothetical protein